MSDPLQTTRQTIDEEIASKHAFQYPSRARVMALVPVKARLGDREAAARLIESSRLDVSMQRARLYESRYCADPEILKRLGGKKAEEVFLASPTDGVAVRDPVPRLRSVAQEMYDVLPVVSSFPAAGATAIRKKALTMAYVSGGTHWSLKRIVEYAPKRGYKVASPPTYAEVRDAMANTGRKPGASAEARRLAWQGEESVKISMESSNGFPVGNNMLDDYAREKVLELAGGLRVRLEKNPDRQVAFEGLQDKFPQFCTFMGKAKEDLYNVSKVSAGQLRFYNVVPRHWALIMQQATQPLAELWKEQGADNYRTMIGKGMAHGGADALVTWLDNQLADQGGVGLAWSHAGDDTVLVYAQRSEGSSSGGKPTYTYSVFSLDCTAFDLTQHRDTTRGVHEAIGLQLREVDAVSGMVWEGFMKKRDVTVSGAVVVRTEHWGPSGMPLQSEVNDTLMEILCRRLAGRLAGQSDKVGSKELEEAVSDVGKGLGFVVRLEEFFSVGGLSEKETPLRWLLERHPFKFVGYYLHVQDGQIVPQIDLPRFMSGMGYLGGAFVADKAAVGVKVALCLAGYALSFGVPHPDVRPAFEVLRCAAVEACINMARQIGSGQIARELSKYVYAALGVSIKTAEGLIEALRKDPNELWAPREQVYLGPALAPQGPIESWADEVEEERGEPEEWEKEFLSLLRPIDLGPQKAVAQAVGPKYAGTHPPTPSSILEERAVRAAESAQRAGAAERREMGARKAHRRQDKRSGVVVDDEESLLYELD